MDRTRRIEHEINKTLEVFDLEAKLPHNPQFFTQLLARMEDKPKKLIGFATLRPVLLAALLVFNIITAISYFSTSSLATLVTTEQNPYELLANDFNLNQNEIDFFNIQ